MSDVSQVPGWWIASDGKWYPPEQHPDAFPGIAAVRAPSVLPNQEGVGATWQDRSEWVASDGDIPHQMSGEVPYDASTAGDLLTSSTITSTVLTDFASSPRPASPTSHKRRGLSKRQSPLLVVTAVIVLGGGVLAYSLTQGSTSEIAAASPSQAIALMTAAVHEAGSVHVVTSIQIQGQTATYVNDSTSHSGKEIITAGTAQVTAIVVGGTAFVKANLSAMSEMFQTSAAGSQHFANAWLSLPSSDPAYNKIAQTLTLGSLLQQVTPTRPLTKLGPATVNGRSVIGVRGQLPGGGSATLYISATGSPLPVEEISGPSGGRTTSVFGGWGVSVNVAPPSGAISGSAVSALFALPGSAK